MWCAIGGEANQWYPTLYEGTTAVEPKKTPEEGYNLVEDMTDKAINWVGQQKALASDKPFFMYFAPGATHAPHHVPKEWADKYEGKFDQGWDKLREETIARQKSSAYATMKTTLARNLRAAALVAALTAAPAHGKECKGVTYPDQMQAGGTALVLNGLGLRQATAFRVNVYVAALYVAQTSADANAILASNTRKDLILQFVRDVGGTDLSKGWQEGFDNNAKAQLPALKERIEQLKGWMADIKTGQRLTFVAKPGAGIEVNVNGAVKGTIEGDDFAKAMK